MKKSIKVSKKALSLFLAVLMIMTSVPLVMMPASAATEGTVSSTYWNTLNHSSRNSDTAYGTTAYAYSDGSEGNTGIASLRFPITDIPTDASKVTVTLQLKTAQNYNSNAEFVVMVAQQNAWKPDDGADSVEETRSTEDYATILGYNNGGTVSYSGSDIYNSVRSYYGITVEPTTYKLSDIGGNTYKTMEFDITEGVKLNKQAGNEKIRVIIMHKSVYAGSSSDGWSDINVASTGTITWTKNDANTGTALDNINTSTAFDTSISATAHGSFAKDDTNVSDTDYANVYKNVLWAATGITADYTNASFTKDIYRDGSYYTNVTAKWYNPETVFLYQGTDTQMTTAVMLHLYVTRNNATGTGRPARIYSSYPTNSTLSLLGNNDTTYKAWRGYDTALNYQYTLNNKSGQLLGFNYANGSQAYETYSGYKFNAADNINLYYANILNVTADLGDNYKGVYNPGYKIELTTDNDQVNHFEDITAVNTAASLWMVNYVPLKTAIEDAEKTYNTRIAETDLAAKYTSDSIKRLADAIGALTTVKPNNSKYNYSAGAETAVNLYATEAKAAVDEYYAAKNLVLREYDITFNMADGRTQTDKITYGTVPTAPTASAQTYNTTDHPNQHSTGVSWDKSIVAVTGDATYTESYSSWADHSMTGTVDPTPTCTGTGKETFKCSGCAYSYTEIVPATGHGTIDAGTAEVRDAVNATCTSKGYTGDTYCKICGVKIATGTETDMIAHNYGSLITGTAATCATGGTIDHYQCSACNKYFDAEYNEVTSITVSATGNHTYGNTVDYIRSNSDGTHSFKCTNTDCNAYSEPVDCIYEIYTQKNNDVYHIAACVCGASKDDEHNWGTGSVTTEPGCTTEGVMTYTCDACKQTKTEGIPSAHKPVAMDDVPATCTASGSTGGTKCSVCQTVITAPTTVIPLGHAWNDGEITTEPKCGVKGVKTYTCTRENCGATKTEDVAALEHTGGTANCEKGAICTLCGTEYTDKNDKNHTALVKHDAKSNSCTDAGCQAYEECTKCGYTTYSEDLILPATGHSYVVEKYEWDKDVPKAKVTLACGNVNDDTHNTTVDVEGTEVEHLGTATCIEPDEVKYKLVFTVDEQKFDSSETGNYNYYPGSVNPNNHDGHLAKVEAKNATCLENGNIEHWYCDACDSYYTDEAATAEVTEAEVTIAKKDHDYSGEYKHDAETDKHSRLCKNGCNEYGDETACSFTDRYEHIEGTETHKAYCVCGNYKTEDCTNDGECKCGTCGGNIPHDYDGQTWKHDDTVSTEYHYMDCNVCGADGRKTQAHNPGEWVIDVNATCQETGSKHKSCTDCGAVVETAEISMIDHKFDGEAKNSGDGKHEFKCTILLNSGGYCNEYGGETECSGGTATCVDRKICDACHTAYGSLDSDNHKSEETETKNYKDSTCTEKGYTGDIYHSCCGALKEQGTEIPMKAHDYTDVAWTSDNNGNHYKDCTVCGETGRTIEECADTNKDDCKCDVCDYQFAHDYKATVTDPTCTEDGYTTYICSVCGEKYTADESEATGHSYSGEVTTAPTCTNKGVKTYKCSKCGDTYTEDIDALGHTEEEIPAVGATCTTDGATAGVKCSVCGEVLKAPTKIDKLGHNFITYVSNGNATCTQDGTKTAKCERCDVTDTVTEEGSALGHKWKAPVFTWNADNTVATAKRTCEKNCEEELDVTMTSSSTDATCLKEGTTTYTATVTVDGESVSESRIVTGSLGAHELTKTDAKAPSCLEDGNIAYWSCSVCAKYFSDENGENETELNDTVVKALGHVEEAVPGHAATCETSGLTDGVRCSRENCGTTIVPQEIIPATDHDYESVVTAPTCTEEGYTTYTCSKCNDSYMDNKVDATGHNYTAETIKAPTCTEKGITTYTCSVCGYSYTDDVAALGHTEAEIPAVDATCTTTGTTAGVKCSVCDTVITEPKTIQALGHDYDEGEVTQEPTNKYEGIITYTCQRAGCGYTYTAKPLNVYIVNRDWTEFSSIPKGANTLVHGSGTFKDLGITSAKYWNAIVVKKVGNEYVIDSFVPSGTGKNDLNVPEDGFVYLASEDSGHHKWISAEDVGKRVAVTFDYKNAEETYKSESFGRIIIGVEHVHTYSEWTSDGNGYHTRQCLYCTEAGNTQTEKCVNENPETDCKCDVCGYEGEHTWTPATCQAPKTCSVCGATEGTPADHSYGKYIEEVPALCESAGVRGHYVCSTCNKNFDKDYAEITDLVIPQKGHKYADVVFEWSETEYTCTAKQICDNDSKHVITYTVADGTLTLTEDESVRVDATCTTEGKRQFTATVTDNSGNEKSESKTYIVAALGHKDENSDGICDVCGNTICTHTSDNTEIRNFLEADCENEGYTGDIFCLDCNNIRSVGEVVPALGHIYKVTGVNWSDYNDGAPTCEVTFTCRRNGCGKTGTDTNAGVTLVEGDEYNKAPSCTEDGYKIYTVTSTFDGAVFDKDNAFGRTDYKNKYTFPADGHRYNDAPEYTWTENGDNYDFTATFKCSFCEHEVVFTKNVSGITNDSTCDTAGATVYSASGTYTDEDGVAHEYNDSHTVTIPAKGHDFSGKIKSVGTDKHNFKCIRCEKYGYNRADGPVVGEAIYCIFEGYIDNGDGTHTGTCECDNVGTEEHYWQDWTQTEGEISHTRACLRCTATDTVGCVDEKINTSGDTGYDCICDVCERALEHVYEETVDEKYKVEGSRPNCEHGTKYYKSCKCGLASATETFYANDKLEHDYKTLVVKNDGTHAYRCVNGCEEENTPVACTGGTATCVAKAKCEVCGAEYGNIDPNNHDYDTIKDETNLTRPVYDETTGEWSKGYYTHTCSRDNTHTTKEYVERADYTEYDKAVKALNDLLTTDITEDAKKAINDALTANAVRNDLIVSEQDQLKNPTANLEQAFKDNNTLKTYKVEFVADGKVVDTQTIISGKDAVAPTTDPTKAPDENNHYSFKAWSGDYTNITKDTTITAEFTSEGHRGGTATCTEKARCEVCQTLYGDIAADNHDFTLESQDGKYLKSEATCMAEAVYYYGCTRCDAVAEKTYKFGEKNPDNHTEQNTIEKGAVEATCTTDGKYGDTYCECGVKLETGATIPAFGHNWTGKKFEWSADNKTCTVTITCERDCEEKFENVSASSEVTQEQTCTLPELTKYTVSVTTKDNKTFSDVKENIETKPAAGHDYDAEFIFDGGKDGSTPTAILNLTCKKGDDTITDLKAEVEEVKGGEYTWVEADCETNGKHYYRATVTTETKSYVSDVEEIITDKLGHDLIFVPAVTATCVKDGNVAHYKCQRTDCGKTFEDEKAEKEITDVVTTDANNHDYKFVDFTWAEGTDGADPTAVANLKCSRDEKHTTTEKADVEKTGETEGDCQTESTKTFTATYGDQSEEKTFDGVTGAHNIVPVEKKDETCTEDGYNAHYKCTVENCGKLFKDEEGETETTLEAETIKAKHILVYVEAVTATCVKDGNVAHYKCQRTDCGKTFEDEKAEKEIADVVTTDANNHLWGEWSQITEDGVLKHTRICTRSDAHTETVKCSDGDDNNCNCDTCGNLVAHDFEAATCELPATCKVCGITSGEKLGHDYTDVAWKNDGNGKHYMDCTRCADGRKTEDCSDANIDTDCNCDKCGALVAHSYEWIVDKDATCGTTGVKHEECSVCHEKRNENTIIEATGKHDYADATCELPATCKVCGITSGEKLGHNYEFVSFTWTEGTDGADPTAVANLKCSRDEKHTTTEKADVEKTGETEGDCQTESTKTFTATYGENTESKTIKGGFGAHKIVFVEAVEGDCTTGGNHAHYKCTVDGCNELYADEKGTTPIEPEDVIIQPGHKLTYVPAKNATCTENGNIEHWICGVCGKYYEDETATKETTAEKVVVPANGSHVAGISVRENVVDATCGKDGSYDEVVYCKACGEELSRINKTIPAYGAHSFTKYAYNFDASCGVNGTETAACDHGCGATDKRIAAGTALSHKWGEYVLTEQKTCHSYEVWTSTCSICNKTKSYENEEAGYGLHYYVIVDGKAPSCTKEGYSDYRYCVTCEERTESQVIPAYGHKDDDGNRYCDNCFAEVGEPIDDGCICHKGNFFSKLVRFIYTIFSKLFNKKITCCDDMEFWS